MAIIVTGGARSGKSKFAEQYAMKWGASGFYIATAQLLDEEMQARAKYHQERRQQSSRFRWETMEEPYELAQLLGRLYEERSASGDLDVKRWDESSSPIILVDCLTLWLTNWLLRYEHDHDCESKVMARITELAEQLARLPDRVIVVTNEVGDSLVPEYALGRRFRDLAGWMNQRIAAVCNQAFLVTMGIPVELKRIAYSIEEL